jgi:hypothetical protein
MSRPTPDAERASIETLAATTPAELADEIRTATAHIYACAQAWRSSTSWRGDKLDLKAYERLIAAVLELDSVPRATTYREVDHLVDVIAPILNGWWSPSPGPKQDLHDAVEVLRHVAMHRPTLVRHARALLGQHW